MINFRFIANLMGRLLLIESAFLLLCVLIALIYGEHDASAFDTVGGSQSRGR